MPNSSGLLSALANGINLSEFFKDSKEIIADSIKQMHSLLGSTKFESTSQEIMFALKISN